MKSTWSFMRKIICIISLCIQCTSLFAPGKKSALYGRQQVQKDAEEIEELLYGLANEAYRQEGLYRRAIGRRKHAVSQELVNRYFIRGPSIEEDKLVLATAWNTWRTICTRSTTSSLDRCCRQYYRRPDYQLDTASVKEVAEPFLELLEANSDNNMSAGIWTEFTVDSIKNFATIAYRHLVNLVTSRQRIIQKHNDQLVADCAAAQICHETMREVGLDDVVSSQLSLSEEKMVVDDHGEQSELSAKSDLDWMQEVDAMYGDGAAR